MAIKYDPELNALLNRTVKNFNKKVRELTRKGHASVPEPVSVVEMKKLYLKREDLKRRIGQLQQFTKRGAEDIVEGTSGNKMTAWEVDVLLQNKRRTKAAITREINYERTKDSKMPLDTAEFIKHLEARRNFLDFDIEALQASEIEKAEREIAKVEYKSSREEAAYQNYIEMVRDAARFAEIDEEQWEKIENTLKKLSPRDLYKGYRNEAIVSHMYIIAGSPKNKDGTTSWYATKEEMEANLENLQSTLLNMLENE